MIGPKAPRHGHQRARDTRRWTRRPRSSGGCRPTRPTPTRWSASSRSRSPALCSCCSSPASRLTLTGAVVALIFLGPLALITSPIWVPVAIALFVLAAAVLSACAFVVAAIAAVAGGTWTYRYFTGRHPVGADRVDYARSRIADTASHVQDYAREYGGGYLHSRAKDAAPGA
ncbi:hypothetical protein GUJ93_ZPchr0010g9081 [Zizania palustris]|uniref:Oleosin n=1 Tax=Zizania palustris TaxID=103762 RepID=A0A8J5WB24_ZIZPA|nr:hypothetical protein GUJ93_ZPchr0010g9081 [Zizania palustris]